MKVIDIEKIENIKWRILYCLFIDYTDYNYRETLFKYITRESFVLLSEANLLWKYYTILKDYYEEHYEMPDFDYIELIIKDKYFDKNSTFQMDFLLSKLDDNKEFINKTKVSNYQSVLNHIKDNALTFIITTQIKALLKKANDLKDINEIAKIAENIQELYEAKEENSTDIILGKPSNASQPNRRLFRPLGVSFIDKYIRDGRGLSEGEIAMGVIPTNQGKGLWSGELAYNSLMLGYDTIIFNTEDNEEDTRNLILAKYYKKHPSYFIDKTNTEINKYIKDMNEKLNSCLIICNLRDFSFEKIKKKIKYYTQKGCVNFRIIIDYFTILGECQNDFNREMPLLKDIEGYLKDNRFDCITFSQVKQNYVKAPIIEEGMSAGSIDKERKVALCFGFTSNNEKMYKREFSMNIFKIRQSDEKPFMELVIDKDTLTFKLKK